MNSFINKLLAFLRSKSMFYTILAVFSLQALWIALSARYPMAFDENFHVGVIQLHSKTWLPFFEAVPAEASTFGAIARDPSFLYHYLFSFPYRLIAITTNNITAQVIILRCINIGLVVCGLLLFRRLLLRIGLDALRTNIVMGFFCLIPIMPLMAAQISYDNLLFLLSGGVLLLGVTFVQRHQQNGTIDSATLTWLLLLCLFASMVKYAFLPVFAAVLLCVGVIVLRNFGQSRQSYRGWLQSQSRLAKGALITLLVAGLGLFAGSYGLNVITYHTAIPRCDKVLSIQACTSYAPWNRDYISAQTYTGGSWTDIPSYTSDWVQQMMYETFFQVTGKFQDGIVVYATTSPLPIIYITAWTLFIIGIIGIIFNYRLIWRNPAYRLLLIVLCLYTAALFLRNLSAYQRTGMPVAIHGRYVIPIILPILGIAVVCCERSVGLLIKRVFGNYRVPRQIKVDLLVAVFVLCLQGGGLIVFLIASNDDWLWQNEHVLQTNRIARSILWPLVYKHDDNY